MRILKNIKIKDVRISILNLKIFNFKKKLEKIRNRFATIAVDKQRKPINELINISYSNNQNFLNLILLMRAYNFHHVLQIQ